MKRNRFNFVGGTRVFSLYFLITVLLSQVVCGTTISPSLSIENNLLLQSVIVDSEVAFLQPSINLGSTDTLVYTSLTSASGWSGTLAGTYAGGSLSITYTGTVTGDPDINVVADGTVSGAMWKSDWEGAIEGETKFGINLDGHLELGINIPVTGLISVNVAAEKDFINHKLEITTGVEAGLGKHGGIDWTLAEASLFYELDQLTGETESGWKFEAGFGLYHDQDILNKGKHEDTTPGTPVHDQTTIQVSNVPETSSTALLLALGLLITAGVRVVHNTRGSR
jgi:hypothetical protein